METVRTTYVLSGTESLGLTLASGEDIRFYTDTLADVVDPEPTITKAGNIGIGTATPEEKLNVVGNLKVQGTTTCILGNGSGATNCTSDKRLKKEIHTIPSALDKILGLRGVEFVWNDLSGQDGKKAIGVVAQDVEKQFPTTVIIDEATGYKMVDDAALVAPLIEAVREQQNQIERQKLEIQNIHDQKDREISSLRLQNQSILSRLEKLEKNTQTDKEKYLKINQ